MAPGPRAETRPAPAGLSEGAFRVVCSHWDGARHPDFPFPGLAKPRARCRVFLEKQAHLDVIAVFLRASRFVKFGVAKFLNHFCFVHCICFAIELCLKLAQACPQAPAAPHKAIARIGHATRCATRGPMRLPVLIQHTTQDLAALLRLPDLVWILVLVELEKLLVRLQCRLGLVQFIVAECADKPLACRGCFHLGDQIQKWRWPPNSCLRNSRSNSGPSNRQDSFRSICNAALISFSAEAKSRFCM